MGLVYHFKIIVLETGLFITHIFQDAAKQLRQDHPHQYHFDVEAAAKVWGDDNCVVGVWLGLISEEILEKGELTKKWSSRLKRERERMREQIWKMRSDGNRARWMVLGGESYSLYSLEHRKPTQEASLLCIMLPPCIGWVAYRIQGSQHGPTTQSLQISSEFLFGMWGFPFHFTSIHSLWCHFGIGVNWRLV